MKKIECDIIQDLLVNYKDKITSDLSNQVVEEHLKECKNCREILENMEEKIEEEKIEKQEEQIDYLKGYRKQKRNTVLFAIALTSILLILLFISLFEFYHHAKFFIDVNEFNVEYMYKTEDRHGKEELNFYLYSEKYKNLYITGTKREVTTKNGKKEIYIKIMGKCQLGEKWSGRNEYVTLEEGVEKIYLEDKKGKVKEIWNKETKVMTEEEWKHWYINSYVPNEIKEKYNLKDENVNQNRGSEQETPRWRYLYDIKQKE